MNSFMFFVFSVCLLIAANLKQLSAIDIYDQQYEELFQEERNRMYSRLGPRDILIQLENVAEEYENRPNKFYQLQLLEELIAISKISQKRCTNEQIGRIEDNFAKFSSFKVNIVPYFKYCFINQLDTCRETMKGLVNSKLVLLSQDTRDRARELFDAVLSRSQVENDPDKGILHLKIEVETLIKGLLHFLHTKNSNGKIKLIRKESEIGKKIHNYFDGVCDKINKTFKPILEYYNSMSLVVRSFDEKTLVWLATARICETFSDEQVKPKLNSLVYKFWNENKHREEYQ